MIVGMVVAMFGNLFSFSSEQLSNSFRHGMYDDGLFLLSFFGVCGEHRFVPTVQPSCFSWKSLRLLFLVCVVYMFVRFPSAVGRRLRFGRRFPSKSFGLAPFRPSGPFHPYTGLFGGIGTGQRERRNRVVTFCPRNNLYLNCR